MTSEPAISPAFPYASHYVEVAGTKLHYIDEGAGEPILFLHGNPTSCYLWRNVIPHLTAQGRCLALDLAGMGKSEKPRSEYRFFDHVRYVEGFIAALGLRNLTLVLHDWGSALGFHYASRNVANVRALAFMEAILMPLPGWELLPDEVRTLFQAFRTPEAGWELSVNQNVFVEQVLPGGVLRGLSEEEMNRYRQPFTDPASRTPLWRWPNEIPIAGEPADVAAAVAAYNAWLQQTELPKLLLHATPGVTLGAPLVAWCRQSLKNLTTADLGPGLHFLQEDNPHGIGEALARWYAAL
ncbi:MAG TPA: haloalkane dehalogenase [Dehalococcoidia bacterium]|nr:haloalkane dehalogenase [Dehalococcoidia bacterium]